MRRNRETRSARLSLAARRRILSSGVVFNPGRTKGYIYMRRRARRRRVIVFEVTGIGTCEENVECSYTRVPLIENGHVQHPSASPRPILEWTNAPFTSEILSNDSPISESQRKDPTVGSNRRIKMNKGDSSERIDSCLYTFFLMKISSRWLF